MESNNLQGFMLGPVRPSRITNHGQGAGSPINTHSTLVMHTLTSSVILYWNGIGVDMV